MKIHIAENVSAYLNLALEQKVDKDFVKWQRANFRNQDVIEVKAKM